MSFWHNLPKPIIGLAPMDGVTDPAFRQIVATHGGPDVVFTEFTNVNDIVQNRQMGWDGLRYSEGERPIVAQIYGKDPRRFYQAAHVIGELGFDGLDINMGCPSKSVASSGCGAALIRTPELALEIMAAAKQGLQDWATGQDLWEVGLKPSVIETVHGMNRVRMGIPNALSRGPIPMSVKTRLGYDDNVITEWSASLIQGAPEVISIHGRTLEQMYRGSADWDAITQVSGLIRKHKILVLGNGDVRSLREAASRIQTSGVDGVLIGRAALGNPWIFNENECFRKAIEHGSEIPDKPALALAQRFRMIINHAKLFELQNDLARFPRMRKHLGWYCSGFPHAAAMRVRMVRTTCAEDVQAVLQEYWVQQGFSEPMALAG